MPRTQLGDPSPGSSDGLSSSDVKFDRILRRKRKPRKFRDKGRLRAKRLIKKRARFRKNILYPADSQNTTIFLGTELSYSVRSNGKEWETSPFLVDKKTSTWDGSFKEIKRTWDWIHPGPPYDEGDDCTIVTIKRDAFERKGVGVYTSTTTPAPGRTKYVYQGGFIPSSFAGDFLSTTNMYDDSKWAPGTGALIPESDVASLGVKGFLRSVPKVQYANFAEFVGEIDDVPKQFKKTAEGFVNIWSHIRRPKDILRRSKRMHKEAADHFLNHTFGWVPFVSDLSQFLDLSMNISQRLHNLYKVNDRWIRVNRRLVEDETVTVLTRGFNMNLNPPGHFDVMQNLMTKYGSSCRAYYEFQRIERKHAWSSGYFKIYRPEFAVTDHKQFSNIQRIRQLLAVYGAEIDPAVLWELTPWSWLIDYFTNIGQLIKIFTRIQSDSALAKNFFVMQTTQSEYKFIQELNWATGLMTLDWSRLTEIKLRRKANNPYHFSFTGDLTPLQLSIMAAVGIGRT